MKSPAARPPAAKKIAAGITPTTQEDHDRVQYTPGRAVGRPLGSRAGTAITGLRSAHRPPRRGQCLQGISSLRAMGGLVGSSWPRDLWFGFCQRDLSRRWRGRASRWARWRGMPQAGRQWLSGGVLVPVLHAAPGRRPGGLDRPACRCDTSFIAAAVPPRAGVCGMVGYDTPSLSDFDLQRRSAPGSRGSV